jgi:hypothetical protein
LNQIRKRLTYANVMSSIAVFLLLGGATAIAAGTLGKNTVGTKQLKKNAVTAAKLKKNAVSEVKLTNSSVSSGKLKDSAVTTSKLADGAVTGAKVQVSSLGTVPNATNAANAANLAGQQSFFIRLNGDQTQTVASNGSVSLVASCEANVVGKDSVKIVAQTSQPGAVLAGTDDLGGPGGNNAAFLEPDTPIDKREFVERSDTTGEINVGSDIDEGFVLGPDGKMIAANSEGIALGLNYGGSVCLVAGVVNLIG